MSNPLEELARSLPKMPTAPKPVSPPKAAAAPEPVVAAPATDAGGSDIAAAALQALLGEACSDGDRYLAFRTLARACGRDLIVQPQTVFSHIMTAGGLCSLLLVLVKTLSFGKAVSGTLYGAFIPNLLIAAALIFTGLMIAFRKKPDIVLLLCCFAVGLLGAVGLLAKL